MIMRNQRGQTGAELLGALLLVSVIIAAVATSDAGAAIAQHSRTLVCRIAGGTCQETTPPGEPTPTPTPTSTPVATATTDPGDTDDDDDVGPPLDEHPPIDFLPFPGSVSVTCTASETPGSTTCSQGEGVGLQGTFEGEIRRSPTSLDGEGCPWQTLSVEVRTQLGVGASGETPVAGGSLSTYLGNGLKYEISVPPDEADAIADGDRPPPNPLDPRTLRTGESIQLTEDYYVGANAEGSYRKLQLELGYDTGTRVSSGVQRISPSTVRVMVGDAEFVRQSLMLGIGTSDVNVALGNEKDLSDGTLHAIDLDISTPAGWDAYQSFVTTGALPDEGDAGASNPTESATSVYTDETRAELNIGPIHFGGEVGSSAGHVTATTHADGSVQTDEYYRWRDKAIAITSAVDANGDPVGSTTRSLLLENIGPDLAGALYRFTGQPIPEHPPSDLRLDFTEAQLNQLKALAEQRLADGVPPIGIEANLAAAETPDELLLALYQSGMDAPWIADDLARMLAANDPLDLPIIHEPTC